MLAIDVSLSMRVPDVKPTRMVAAREAARTFLHELPANIQVGIVTFAGSAQVAQQATIDRPSLISAIVVCLAELLPEQGIDLGEMTFGSRRKTRARDEKEKARPTPITPVAPGSYDSAAIILLSDGRRTTGIDTLEAAKMAADRGVRIYAVGLGTVDGPVAAGEGMAIYMQLDEPTLREVARMTGGEFYHAGTAEDLRSVYQNLGSRVQIRKRETELTALLAMVAAILFAAGSFLSMLWFGRIA
jgi:Ca-activated chloride channel family protein